ncbi:MAG: cobalamin-dependent protein, partial [Verrucomicrobiota bacterium]
MKIGLIAMSGVRVRTAELAELGVTLPQFVNRGKVIASLPSLGLLTVAALTPNDIEVAYREVNEFDPTAELEAFDLVGISSFSAQIDEAYALADRYRAAGIPVVLGGLHVSMMPQEAMAHADSIVLNGAEGAWPRLVEDFKRGQMQPCYEGLRRDVFKAPHYVQPRFDLLEGRPYNRLTVQTSRGCPLSCEFCAASLRITSSFQQKPVDLVIDEIKTAREVAEHPFFEFADDNTFINKTWGKALLRKLTPLGISWFTETDISVADDAELLERMAESGCRQILIGLESPVG